MANALNGVFFSRSGARSTWLALCHARTFSGCRVYLHAPKLLRASTSFVPLPCPSATSHTRNTMKPIDGYFLIKPEDLHWRPSSLMKIPNADYLERIGSENLGARLWRLPPNSANTLHKHIRAEEFYFVLEGVGRMRVGDETLTVPKYGGVLVGPDQLRQVFNDTDAEVLWLIVGAPEETELLAGSKTQPDMSLIYPVDPKQLPKELVGVEWPPKS